MDAKVKHLAIVNHENDEFIVIADKYANSWEPSEFLIQGNLEDWIRQQGIDATFGLVVADRAEYTYPGKCDACGQDVSVTFCNDEEEHTYECSGCGFNGILEKLEEEEYEDWELN